MRLVSSLSIVTCTDFVYCRAGPDEYQGLMNALKRHVDSSLQKLETTSAEHQAAALEKLEKNLETKSAEHQAALIEVQKQNAELVRQNSKMLKMLKGLRSKA